MLDLQIFIKHGVAFTIFLARSPLLEQHTYTKLPGPCNFHAFSRSDNRLVLINC